ncbi:MAG: tetratricopeptide repeat protein, partial [Panacibacter sp.]
MRTSIICLLIVCYTIPAFAQTAKIDSLNKLIGEATTDTARIKLLIKKAKVLGNINLDSSTNLALKTLEEIKKINFYKGEIEIRQRLATNYCFKGDYKAASEQLDYLEHFIKPSKDSSDFADMYSNFGMLYGMQSKYDSSIYFYKKSLDINLANNNKDKISTNYSNIAIGYQQQSNFSRALFYQQKALKIAEDEKDEVHQAYTLTNMANTYDGMGDSVRAEKTYLKAAELAKKNDLTNVELYSFTNLSSMYINQGKWQKGYDFALKAATLGEAMGDDGIQAASISKGAVALANMHQWEPAVSLAQKAIIIADSSAQPLNISQAYCSMGSVLRLQNKWKDAIPFYEKGFLALQGSDIYNLANGKLYKELSECYEKTGNYTMALQVYKKAALIADSVRSKDNIQKATELTMNYEFEKKEQLQKAEQKAKDDIAGAKQMALIVGLGLTLALAIVAFIGFKNKQKANALLEQHTAEIQSTLTQLKSTQTQLIQSEKMASLGELTAGIAHEIQNPLNFVNNFSDISVELADELKEEIQNSSIPQNEKESINEIISGLVKNQEMINHHGKRADSIVKAMLVHSRSSTGIKEPTDVNALADEYLRLSYHGLRAKDKSFNATMETDFDSSIGKIYIIPQDIGRVLMNLYNNAFYAVAERKKQEPEGYEPTVLISTKKVDGMVEIKVRDNGSGIPQHVLEKIFQPFFTTKPTGQGTGLGLSLSYDIITKG